jgi:RRXRR protein
MRLVAVISGKYRVVSVSRGTLVLRKEPYLMKVFVLSKPGTPLMPTTPRRARLWLKAKRVRDAAHVSSVKSALVSALRDQFGVERIVITYGYETKYKRIQVLDLPKSHTNDAVAIACGMGEAVKPGSLVYQIRCVPRGNYQLFNGKRGEHRVWAPKKLHGWKLYELVEAKGVRGYIGGRRVKGAFVVKDIATAKTMLEVTPRKLRRLSRPTQGWIIQREEERASSPA